MEATQLKRVEDVVAFNEIEMVREEFNTSMSVDLMVLYGARNLLRRLNATVKGNLWSETFNDSTKTSCMLMKAVSSGASTVLNENEVVLIGSPMTPVV